MRTRILAVHRWIALALFPLVLMQALTGSLLVFRSSIEPLIHPSLGLAAAQGNASVQSALDAAQATRPGARIERITYGDRPCDTARVTMHDPAGDSAWIVGISPCDARVLRTGGLWDWPMEAARELHETLLSDDSGATLVGLLGLGLLIILGLGLWIWWPGKGHLATGFRIVKGRGAGPLLRSVHKSVGAAMAAIIVVSAATGTWMVFKSSVRDVMGSAYAPKPSPKIPPRVDAPLLPADVLVARAGGDRAALSELRFSGAAGQVVAVYLRANDVMRSNAANIYSFDRYSGELLGSYLPRNLPLANDLIDWAYPVHTGMAAGSIGRFLILSGGLSLAFLTVGGLVQWLLARRGRHARRKSRT